MVHIKRPHLLVAVRNELQSFPSPAIQTRPLLLEVSSQGSNFGFYQMCIIWIRSSSWKIMNRAIVGCLISLAVKVQVKLPMQGMEVHRRQMASTLGWQAPGAPVGAKKISEGHRSSFLRSWVFYFQFWQFHYAFKNHIALFRDGPVNICVLYLQDDYKNYKYRASQTWEPRWANLILACWVFPSLVPPAPQGNPSVIAYTGQYLLKTYCTHHAVGFVSSYLGYWCRVRNGD